MDKERAARFEAAYNSITQAPALTPQPPPPVPASKTHPVAPPTHVPLHDNAKILVNMKK